MTASLKKTIALFLSLLSLAFPTVVQAQITNPVIKSLGDDAEAAQQGTTFLGYFVVLWRALITVGALIVVVYFLWGAIEWIVAGGDTGKVQKARDRMTQAGIGLVILVASFTILAFLSMVFFGDNFNILELTIPDPLETTP